MAISTAQKTALNNGCESLYRAQLGTVVQDLQNELPTGDVVGTSDVQTLTEKTLDWSDMTVGTGTAGIFVTTGTTWVNFATVGQKAVKLLCSTSATSGDYATLCIRARADAAGNAAAGNFSASAGDDDHGDLRAVEGYAQPMAYTNADADNIVCGVYSCIDATGASSGRRWSAWVDTHAETKADASDYLLRLSHNGTVANDGAITIYNGGRMPVLFNFEDAAGFLTETGDAGSTKAGYIAVTTPAGTKYIQLVTV